MWPDDLRQPRQIVAPWGVGSNILGSAGQQFLRLAGPLAGRVADALSHNTARDSTELAEVKRAG